MAESNALQTLGGGGGNASMLAAVAGRLKDYTATVMKQASADGPAPPSPAEASATALAGLRWRLSPVCCLAFL